MDGNIADKIIRPAVVGVAIFVANRAHYVWYWQAAIIIAVVTAGYGISLAIKLVLASRNK